MPPKLVLADSPGQRADALPLAFQCFWRDGGVDGAWVHLPGDVDVATAPRLERLLREPRLQARMIVLDLRDLVSIDRSAVRAIVDAGVRSRRAGRRMLLLSGRPGLDRVFTLTATAEDVRDGDIRAVEPSVEALIRLVDEEVAP